MSPKKNKRTDTVHLCSNSPLKRAVTIFLSLLLGISCTWGQEGDARRIPFRVMEWNVENLFDTRHDTLKDDREFLPTSLRRWTYARYRKKLADIARVIAAAGEGTPPALVGLCEVENDRVLADLTRYSPLKELGYRYIVTQSPDVRGIDVALLYQPGLFKPLSSASIPVPPIGNARPTRDILHVCGRILTGDTLDLLVCHLPSRRGDVKTSEPYRIHAATLLRHLSDNLLRRRVAPKLIVMGDFNDYPSGKSVRTVLQTGDVPHAAPTVSPAPGQPPFAPCRLYHLLAEKAQRRGFGSYKYKGEWKLIDHLMVSGALLDTAAGFHTEGRKADVLRLPMLLADDLAYGGDQPFRTYKGMDYQGGISDHLPVYADFELVLGR